VLAGDREHFDRAEALAGELGRRTIRLPVAGAFHSPSMAPAVTPFRAALDAVELGEPRFTVFSCASARPFEDVREELAGALVRPVRWRETFTALHAAGATRFIEVGPGKVLARLAKRIVAGAKVETPPEAAVHA
jgi:malonyl CoA-acyl carrier protein transacylase